MHETGDFAARFPAASIPLDALDHPPLTHTLANALIVTRREVRDSFRDWRIMTPIFLLTLVFPLLANVLTDVFVSFFVDHGADPLLPALLPLLPMIVGFFPVSISLVIALETFVGEKERLSLEPLLSTPLTNTELYLGKSFAAMIPPLLASYTGLLIYLGGLILGPQQWRPPVMLIVQIVVLTTVQALLMVTGAVVISSHTTSTRAANLLASFIIIPVSILVMLEGVIMVQPHRRFLLWIIALGLAVIAVLFVRMGARLFNREDLLGRTLDQVRLRRLVAAFWTQFRGSDAPFSLRRWYREGVFSAVACLRTSALVVLLCVLLAFAGGALMGLRWRLPMDVATTDRATLTANLRAFFDVEQGSLRLVLAVLFQNVRVLALGGLLASFTFGVAPLVFVMLPFGIIGFLVPQVVTAPLDPALLLAGIAPHGLFEIPAIVLAGAATLRLGAIVTRPPHGQTAGQAWLRTLADVAQVGVGVVLPLLVIAAAVEVLLTPRVIEFVLTL